MGCTKFASFRTQGSGVVGAGRYAYTFARMGPGRLRRLERRRQGNHCGGRDGEGSLFFDGSAGVGGNPGRGSGPGHHGVVCTGSVELTAPSKAMLREFGKAFKEHLAGVAVIIEGHADPRGGEEYNLELSQRRAAVVRDYLVAQLGNDPKQFEIVGFGQTRLMDPKNPTANVNRRVEFVTKNIL